MHSRNVSPLVLLDVLVSALVRKPFKLEITCMVAWSAFAPLDDQEDSGANDWDEIQWE